MTQPIEQEKGASADADRAASLTASAADASSQSGIPSAANDYWSLWGNEVVDGRAMIETGDRVCIELTGSLANRVPDEEVRQMAELVMAAPALAKLLARLEPHLDAIICYASTMGEHAPNAIAADLRGWLGHLRNVGSIGGAA